MLPFPDSLLINGRGLNGNTFTVDQGHFLHFLFEFSLLQLHMVFVDSPKSFGLPHIHSGKTYRFRISNVGLMNCINIRFQGHTMVLVEVEGSHTLQNTYSSLDVCLGQSYSVLVTANQPPRDYYIVSSTRFTNPVLATTAILHYSNSAGKPVDPPPGGPTIQIDWSLNQARSIRHGRGLYL